MSVMVLSTHAVGGAAAALLFPRHPIIAFLAGFASHFLLDAIPHWHYRLRSLKKPTANPMDHYFVFDRTFLEDLVAMAADVALGLVALLPAIVIAPGDTPFIILCGALGGIMPDALQIVYYLFRRSPIKYLQRFHKWIHAKTRLDHEPVLGIGAQLLLICLFFFGIVRFLI